LGCPWGVVGILGRFGGGFRDFPGNYGSHFGAILGPFWAHFAIQSPPRNLIDFFIDFVLILASFLDVFLYIFEFYFGFFAKLQKPENSTAPRREHQN
jgi:hypothetical protein